MGRRNLKRVNDNEIGLDSIPLSIGNLDSLVILDLAFNQLDLFLMQLKILQI